MKKLAINPSNKKYYSDDYIKGWEDGVKAQYEATKDAVEVVRCKDCVYCTVQNTKYIYAICLRHGIEFKPFEDDTRTHFCSWGERIEP